VGSNDRTGSTPVRGTKLNEMKASEKQEGGDHYRYLKIQPTEFIHKNGIPFIEGNIIKYVLRHKYKNKLEDLKKARHYLDLLIEFEYGVNIDEAK
jgi:Protein of unknwon function (DUF3310)